MIPAAEKNMDDYQKAIPISFIFENYFFSATCQEFQGRIRRALKVSRGALRLKPDDELTKEKMVQRLERISASIDTHE